MKFFKFSRLWFEIWSDLFVNLAAGWFGIILLDPKQELVMSGDFIGLTVRVLFGILSIMAAKLLKEESKKWK